MSILSVVFGVFIFIMGFIIIIPFHKSKIGLFIAFILLFSGGSMIGYGYYLVEAPDIKEGILIEKFRDGRYYYFVIDNEIKLRQYSISVDEYYQNSIGDEVEIDIN